ncbi:MAG: hypothetical protein NC483_06690 [Ruminococcus sp.]|nr:hypothetical protein [Ruminococcus sp.]
MFKENIMKKIAGLSLAAVVMMPGVAKAAITIGDAPNSASGANDMCTATTMAEFEECMSKKDHSGETPAGNDYSKITTITLSGATFTIDKSLTITDYDIIATKLIVDSNKTLTLKGTSSISATTIEVNKGTLNITTKANTAIKGALDVKSGVVSISADNTNGNAASSENGAVAVTGDITVDAGTLTVTRGELSGDITKVSGASTVKIQDITGSVTMDGDRAASLTAGTIEGGLTVNGTSKVTVEAKEINTSVAVNNEKATVQYAGDGVTPSVTKGLVKKTNIVSANVSNVEVYTNGLSSVELAKNEVLVVENVNDLGENFKVTGPNGAKIDNKSNVDLTITVNGNAVTVSKDANGDDAYVIAGAQDTNPEQPGDATQTPDGDTTIDKNPATGDSIMSYVALAVSSVASLGLAVKKFLF